MCKKGGTDLLHQEEKGREACRFRNGKKESRKYLPEKKKERAHEWNQMPFCRNKRKKKKRPRVLEREERKKGFLSNLQKGMTGFGEGKRNGNRLPLSRKEKRGEIEGVASLQAQVKRGKLT